MSQPEGESDRDAPTKADEDQEQLISRLIARIADLEDKLYRAEFEQQAVVPVRPPEPEAPRLGFLSAIRAGLRQLEESTGYAEPAPKVAQAHGARIVYYQTPPQGVVEQLQHSQPLQVETSHGSGTSSVATSDWASTRLGLPTSVPPLDVTHNSTPAEPSPHGELDSQLQSSVLAKDVRTSISFPGLRPAPSMASSSGSGDIASSIPDTITSTNTASTRTQTPTEVTSSKAGATDWFSSFFRSPKPQQPQPSPSKQAVRAEPWDAHPSGDAPTSTRSADSASRQMFDPADIAAEMEVTARVRRVAAEALREAETKLAAAQEAQADMQRQLAEAQDLSKELELLRRDNEQARATRNELEGEMDRSRQAVEAMRAAQEGLQQELEELRSQAGIWQSANTDEKDKLKQENQLLRNQMHTRLNEVQMLKMKLAEAESERQRLTKALDDLQSKLQWLTKINKQLEASAHELEDHRKHFSEMQEKFFKERAVRRKLHEQLQQLRGNIRVLCRVRPCLPNQANIITYPLEGLLSIHPPDRRHQEFEFDNVFGPEVSQEAVYEEVSPLVRSCADGYNVCIFAYGQTGSGKTYTMEGPDERPGINVRALQELFNIGSEESIDLHWKVQVSMLEVYNDTVYDLLVPPSGAYKPLEVSGLGAGELPPGAERVPGATWRPVNSLEEVRKILKEGSKNRSTASTALNAHSSRSHAVLSVRVTAHANNLALRSVIHLVDLAGSERVDKSEVSGAQLKEAQSINKSLSALGDVISALQRKTPHVPFRNSKLTQVLQDSLCGSSKVLLVCNISPESASASETMSSLNFASRAGQVELGQARRVVERQPNTSPALVGASGGAPGSTPDRLTPSAVRTRDSSGMKSIRSSQNVSRVNTPTHGGSHHHKKASVESMEHLRGF